MELSPFFRRVPIAAVILLLPFLSISNAAKSANPKSFFIPIYKNPVKTQYYIKPQLGSPDGHEFYSSIDLSGQNLFINCDSYNSSSHTLVPCGSAECDAIGDGFCAGCVLGHGCNSGKADTCGSFAYNPLGPVLLTSGIVKDTIFIFALPSPVRVSGFPFACSSAEYMKGLSVDALGIVGLGSSLMGLVAQISSAFKLEKTVSVCLPSSGLYSGAVVIGSLASAVKPNISLIRTPLVPYPIKNILPAQEYFIGVKTVRISVQAVALNSSLLSLDKDGIGGTKLNTIQPWTVVNPELYGPIVVGFVRKALSMKLKRMAGVRPFGACFSTAGAGKTATGPAVPTIELDLNGDGQWKIYGANSMVIVNDEVMCLGIVKSTSAFGPGILIGGHTLQDNLLELDQRAKTLRFSASLLGFSVLAHRFWLKTLAVPLYSK